MKIDFVPAATDADAKSALVVSAFETGQLRTRPRRSSRATGGALSRAIKGGRFKGALGQTLDVVAPHGLDAARVLVVGLGKADAVDGRVAKQLAAGHAYQALKATGVETIMVRTANSPEISARIALGVRLASYRFDNYRTKEKPEKKPSVIKTQIVAPDVDAALAAFAPLAPWPTRSASPATWSPSRRTSYPRPSSPAG